MIAGRDTGSSPFPTAKRALRSTRTRTAPIFRIAGFGIAGDVHHVLPTLSAEIARRRGARADGLEFEDAEA
jgi:hypothetical protein